MGSINGAEYMKKVRLNVDMLAWQYRAGHEEAMKEAMKPHGIGIEKDPWEHVKRVILTSYEGMAHSVFDTNYVILANWGVEVLPEDEFVRDYTRVG